jgi:anti-sigma regulatory factor (Ser/Thr protein kinase)
VPSSWAVDVRHEALLYAGDDAFLAGTVPFVRDGIAAGEAVCVALDDRRRDQLAGALGPAAAEVAWVDVRAVGRNPARLLPMCEAFADANPGRPVRGLGEPVWRGRSDAELDECRRHEALVNVAFGDRPDVRMRCPYDLSTLPAATVQEAARTHPHVVEHGLPLPSPAYRPLAVLDGDLPAPPPTATAVAAGRDDLALVRHTATRAADAAGLPAARTADLQLVATELASNAIVHGDGRADLRTWVEDRTVVCQVTGGAPVADPLTGRRRPSDGAAHGWGLYVVNQLADLVQLRSDARRTLVRARVGP